MKCIKSLLAVAVIIIGTHLSYCQLLVRPQAIPLDLSKNLVTIEGERTAVKKELTQKITELVGRKDFLGLEKLADNLRKSKVETSDGTRELLTFYRILTLEWTDTDETSDAAYKARLDVLKSWVDSKPASTTAQISLARFYKNYAWYARGLGFANTVNDEGWRLFAERLKLAKETLEAAKKLDVKCPVWWDTMQYVALGESWDLASYNKLFNSAVAFDSSYTFFYNNKVMYLLPRWFGQEGDWQKFATESADKIGGEAGDILYARIGWRIHERGIYEGFLRDSGYSWPRLKNGLEAIIKKYPNSLTVASELAFLAYQSKDRECAQPLFERIDQKVDFEIWQNDNARFLRARTWSLWRPQK
jgi:hypothetical protein